MKFSRRDFVHAACTIGAATLSPSSINKAKALLHRSGIAVSPTGKNQVGLNGINNSSVYPFTNWWKMANGTQLIMTMNGSALSWAAGTATITTPVAHGLFNGSGKTIPGLWNIQNITGAGIPAGYKLSGSIFTAASATTITYPIASDPGAATGTFTFQLANVSSAQPINNANSIYGVQDNPLQFIDANRNIQPNIANVTSITTINIWITNQPSAIYVQGYSRAGQQLTVQWTGASAATVSGWTFVSNTGGVNTWTFNLTSAQDNANVNFQMNGIDPASPPVITYFGLTDNLANWNNGIYCDPGATGVTGYEQMLKPAAGVIRFMDWMNTNANPWFVNKYSDFATVSTQAWGGRQASMPVAVMTSLANRVNKHPWFNIPMCLGTTKYLGDNLSGAGQGGGAFQPIVTGISKSNPAVVTFSAAHPFINGDQIIILMEDGSGAAANTGASFGVNATVTFTAGTTNVVNWTGHSFAAGQPVVFNGSGTLPTGVKNIQRYYVANPTTNAFQICLKLSDALAGTNPVSMVTTGSGTLIGSSAVGRTQFTVAGATTYTLQLQNCDSTTFGTAPTHAQVTTPVNLTGMTTEITNLVNAIKSGLASQLIPRFEWGNELWNNTFPTFSWLSAQARNFVDATGAAIFPNDDNAKLSGYLVAHALKTVRDAYGAPARATWQGIMATQSGNSTITSSMISGVNYYLANFAPASGLAFNDLIDNIALTGYWGSIFASNGTQSGSMTVTFASGGTTLTVTSGTNTLPTGSPIMLTSTGTLPANLGRGDGSALVTFNVVSMSAGTMTTSGSPALAAGMTVYGPFNGSLPFSGVIPTKITGGSANTWTIDNNQTVGAKTGCQARDLSANINVYWTIGTGNSIQLSLTQGGSAITFADAGTGTHTMKQGTSTLICNWMNTSTANNIADPVTYPSKYSWFNSTVNTELNNSAIMKLSASSGFGYRSISGLQTFWSAHVTVMAGASLIPAVGLVQYEGGASTEPQGNMPSGISMTADPQFNEFWGRIVGTTEYAANWTGMVAAWNGLPTFTSQPTLKVGYPSQFTDAVNVSNLFGFGALFFVDHFQGIGSPNWQQSLNGHPVYDALVASN